MVKIDTILQLKLYNEYTQCVEFCGFLHLSYVTLLSSDMHAHTCIHTPREKDSMGSSLKTGNNLQRLYITL